MSDVLLTETGDRVRTLTLNRPHARNALSRVSQNGSEQEQREVRKKVEQRYPDLKQD